VVWLAGSHFCFFQFLLGSFPRPLSRSPQRWGLGGTCVNVGCIPKKLMHFAAHAGEALVDADKVGWKWTPNHVCHHHDHGPDGDASMSAAGYGEKAKKPDFNWSRLVEAVQDHIGSLNWGYRVALRDKKVEYINAKAKFVDPWTIESVNRAKAVSTHTARNIIVAVGGRPTLLDIPGSEMCISSDDIFSLDEHPGKTLCVGASYIALECASFLSGIGVDTDVMVRSIFLRGYDQDIANQIAAFLESHGTKFIRESVPTRIEATDDGRKRVFFKPSNGGEEQSEVYDTILVAVGRSAITQSLDLAAAGVTTVDERTGKIVVNEQEQTNQPHIFALGDVIFGRPELTPVAIQAGRLLARRLTIGSKVLMDYANVPTTVFTHLEYSCVGLSQEAAAAQCGNADDGTPRIEVYHAYFKPLEWTVTEREDNVCYVKVITERPADGSDCSGDERILGMHYLGPHAGEVITGYAVAMKLGLTKNQLDSTVGVHPTSSEEFVNLNLHATQRSGEDPKKTGC
jgi:thioredoxin reductase (NADPH)